MYYKKYTIEITNVNGKLDGMLIVNNTHGDVVYFSPINILGDLEHYIFTDNLADSIEINNCYIEGNLSLIQEISATFETVFKVSAIKSDIAESMQYFRLISNLPHIFNFKNAINQTEMIRIRQYFDLNFKLKLYEIKNVNACCGNLWQSDDLTEISNPTYIQLKQALSSKPSLCVFLCNSKAEVVFSILQYLLLNGYNFKQCLHCQKFYAYKSLDKGFCCRLSPLTGFEQYECEEAVKMAKKKLQAEKRAILSNIIAKSGTKSKKKQGIENIFEELKKQIKEKPNAENLYICEQFLINDEMKAHHYLKYE